MIDWTPLIVAILAFCAMAGIAFVGGQYYLRAIHLQRRLPVPQQRCWKFQLRRWQYCADGQSTFRRKAICRRQHFARKASAESGARRIFSQRCHQFLRSMAGGGGCFGAAPNLSRSRYRCATHAFCHEICCHSHCVGIGSHRSRRLCCAQAARLEHRISQQFSGFP